MEQDTFYTDHWRHIEDERVARYEKMFVWRDAQQALLQGADLLAGERVLDLGCGPGFFAAALADMVGASGQVHGVDINARFVADATERNRDVANLDFHLLEDHQLPFPDGEMNLAVMKNVLEYVPDLAATLSEVFRVVAPGGRAHVIDSDWGFVLVEPWGKAVTDAFFAAAAPAFKEPMIGRQLSRVLQQAGFAQPEIKISAMADQKGFGLNVLNNMASYIRQFDTMPSSEVETLLAEAEASVDRGEFLFVLPQFLVTAQKEG